MFIVFCIIFWSDCEVIFFYKKWYFFMKKGDDEEEIINEELLFYLILNFYCWNYMKCIVDCMENLYWDFVSV